LHYKYNNQVFENTVYREYKNYNKIIESGLVNTLNQIIKGEEVYTFAMNLIFNIKTVGEKDSHNEFVKMTPYSIEISNLRNNISIDIISLKEHLKNLFPSYFLYTTNLANSEIINSEVSTSIYKNSFESNLENNLILCVTLGISKEFYAKHKEQMWIRQLYFSFVSGVLCLILFMIYRQIVKKSEKVIKKLQNDLFKQQEIIVNHRKNTETHKHINNDFIQKATKMYLEEVGTTNNMHLFPLSLFDKSNNQVDLLKLKEVINNYFCDLLKNLTINISFTSNDLVSSIGKETLYQIVISIINNIILIIQDQTDKERAININISNLGMKFEFIAFPLNIKKIKQLSKMINKGSSEVFLLDFEKIITSLEKHDISYKLLHDGNLNTFTMQFIQNRAKENVIKFMAKNK